LRCIRSRIYGGADGTVERGRARCLDIARALERGSRHAKLHHPLILHVRHDRAPADPQFVYWIAS
jgi:hypothetical protein